MIRINTTNIQDCFIIYPKVLSDTRGSFMESFNGRDFTQVTGLTPSFIQDNLSVSRMGVLRGLHFQKEPYAQAKLVQVPEGRVQDVVVDLRPDSPSYLQHISVILDSEEPRQLFIPKGCAHGFLCLTEKVIFHYKCDAYYHPEAEGGIRFDDETLGISWGLPKDQIVLSEKDKRLPSLKDLGIDL